MKEAQIHAPQRLLDDPQLGAALRQDLELAHAHAPLDYDVGSGLARFEQSLAAGATPATVGGAALGVRVLAWFMGGSILLASAVGAGVLLDQAEARAKRTPVVVEPVIDREVSRPGDEVAGRSLVATTSNEVASAAVEAPAPEPTADAPASGEKGGARADTSPRPNSKLADQPVGSLADEAKRINAARKALENDPSKALQIVEATAKQYPDGAMIQEREGYAVLALTALGRASEAKIRGQRYLERWPNGTLARRVRDALR